MQSMHWLIPLKPFVLETLTLPSTVNIHQRENRKKEKPLAALSYLCHHLHSKGARYGFTVLSFLNGIGFQEADHNTFLCFPQQVSMTLSESQLRRPPVPQSGNLSKIGSHRLPICVLSSRQLHVPAAYPPSRHGALSEQWFLLDQDPSFVHYDLISFSRIYLVS